MPPPSPPAGHGDVRRPHGENAYAPAMLAEDVIAHLDERDIEAAVIVGHSAGSYTAQPLAVDHPDRTRGLVLIGAVRSAPDHGVLDELDPVVSQLTDPVDISFVREFRESTLAQPIPPAFLDTAIAESRKLPARVWQEVLGDLLATPAPLRTGGDRRADAPALGGPGRDPPARRPGALAAAVPGAELLVHAGHGLAPHWEQPRRAAADIAAFARRAVSPRATRRLRSAAAR